MTDTPQTPTDGENDTPDTPVKAPAAPAAEAKTETKTDPVTPAKEKPLPGLSVEAPPKKAPESRAGAPEKYEWKIDGDPKYVSRVTGKLEPVARKLGLSNEEVHGVYDTFAGVMRENSSEMFKDWAARLASDKEIGGDKLEENLGLANSIVAQYGDDELRGLLDKAGLRHNPAIVRLLVNMAKDVGGDRVPRVSDRSVGRSSEADWYPTMKK